MWDGRQARGEVTPPSPSISSEVGSDSISIALARRVTDARYAQYRPPPAPPVAPAPAKKKRRKQKSAAAQFQDRLEHQRKHGGGGFSQGAAGPAVSLLTGEVFGPTRSKPPQRPLSADAHQAGQHNRHVRVDRQIP